MENRFRLLLSRLSADGSNENVICAVANYFDSKLPTAKQDSSLSIIFVTASFADPHSEVFDKLVSLYCQAIAKDPVSDEYRLEFLGLGYVLLSIIRIIQAEGASDKTCDIQVPCVSNVDDRDQFWIRDCSLDRAFSIIQFWCRCCKHMAKSGLFFDGSFPILFEFAKEIRIADSFELVGDICSVISTFLVAPRIYGSDAGTGLITIAFSWLESIICHLGEFGDRLRYRVSCISCILDVIFVTFRGFETSRHFIMHHFSQLLEVMHGLFRRLRVVQTSPCEHLFENLLKLNVMVLNSWSRCFEEEVISCPKINVLTRFVVCPESCNIICKMLLHSLASEPEILMSFKNRIIGLVPMASCFQATGEPFTKKTKIAIASFGDSCGGIIATTVFDEGDRISDSVQESSRHLSSLIADDLLLELLNGYRIFAAPEWILQYTSLYFSEFWSFSSLVIVTCECLMDLLLNSYDEALDLRIAASVLASLSQFLGQLLDISAGPHFHSNRDEIEFLAALILNRVLAIVLKSWMRGHLDHDGIKALISQLSVRAFNCSSKETSNHTNLEFNFDVDCCYPISSISPLQTFHLILVLNFFFDLFNASSVTRNMGTRCSLLFPFTWKFMDRCSPEDLLSCLSMGSHFLHVVSPKLNSVTEKDQLRQIACKLLIFAHDRPELGSSYPRSYFKCMDAILASSIRLLFIGKTCYASSISETTLDMPNELAATPKVIAEVKALINSKSIRDCHMYLHSDYREDNKSNKGFALLADELILFWKEFRCSLSTTLCSALPLTSVDELLLIICLRLQVFALGTRIFCLENEELIDSFADELDRQIGNLSQNMPDGLNQYSLKCIVASLLMISKVRLTIKASKSHCTTAVYQDMGLLCPTSQCDIMAISRAIQCLYSSHVQVSIFLLYQLISSWLEANRAGNTAHLSLVFTEICFLRQLGILKFLISCDLAAVVRLVYAEIIIVNGTKCSYPVLEAFTAECVLDFGIKYRQHLASLLISELCVSGYFSNEKSREPIENILLSVGSSGANLRFDADAQFMFNLLTSDKFFQGQTPSDKTALVKLSSLIEVFLEFAGPQYWAPRSECFFTEANVTGILLLIVWEFGGSKKQVEAAHRSLKLLCLMSRKSGWFSSELMTKFGSSNGTLLTIPSLLSSNFLYLMTNLIHQKWSIQPELQQQQSIRALCEVVSVLSFDQVMRYFPKILTVLDSSINSYSPRVRFTATRLVSTLLRRLPPELVERHVFNLIVGLYGILEEINGLCRGQGSLIGEVCLKADLKTPFSAILPDQSDSIDVMAWNYFDASNRTIIDEIWVKFAQDEAIGILNYLFLERHEQYRSVLQFIPLLPSRPDLEAINKLQARVNNSMTQSEHFDNILVSLKNESVGIKILTLRRLKALCCSCRHDVYLAVFESESEQKISKAKVFAVLHELISLCSREGDIRVLEECAGCLGEIGAIDPGMWNSNVAADAVIKKSTVPAWDLSQTQFGFLLLENFLVPSLRSAGPTHDGLGLAIQRILRKIASSCSNLTASSAEDAQAMPRDLQLVLESKPNLEVISPFWHSRYNLGKEFSILKPPFFSRNISFVRWIGLWIRYLAPFCSGKFVDFFVACRVAVRFLGELSVFLLPHVICDIVATNMSSEVYQSIIMEITLVLQIGGHRISEDGQIRVDDSRASSIGSDDRAKAVQAVLDLLDTLSDWSHSGSTSATDEKERARVQKNLKGLINSIPKTLWGAAALRIKSYIRALRYFEDVTRDNWRLGVNCATCPVNGSNGSIQLLSEEEVNRYMTLFSKIDIIDALQGVQIVRQIGGYRETPKSRILDCEQRGDWVGALMEYNILLGSGISTTSTHYSQEAGEIDSAEVERGRLRCLINLGHFESALDQANGVLCRNASVGAAIMPLGMEAAWRLMDWSRLQQFIEPKLPLDHPAPESNRVELYQYEAEDQFQCNVGKLLYYLKEHKQKEFLATLKLSQLEVMSGLATAAKESYERAHPYLSRLQILVELKDGFTSKQQAATVAFSSSNYCWEQRLKLIQFSPSITSTVQAVRRAILGIFDRSAEIAQNWLSVCNEMRKMGKFDSAHLALRSAQRSDLGPHASDIVQLNECLILRDSGETSKALKLLEPIEIDVMTIRSQRSLSDELVGPYQSEQFISRFHLATKLMVESRQKLGRVVMDRYSLLMEMQPGAVDTIGYEYARYLDTLYEDTRIKDALDVSPSLSSAMKSQQPFSMGGAADGSRVTEEPLSVRYLKQALTLYGRCLSHGGSGIITQALPRMLTLWFSFTDYRDAPAVDSAPGKTVSTSKLARSLPSALVQAQKSINDLLLSFVHSIPASKWYSCMTQLVSRVGHRNPATNAVIISILERVLFAFPAHGIWHFASLLKSSHTGRAKIANDILDRTIIAIRRQKQVEYGDMLRDSRSLFSDLVSLAEIMPNQKRIVFPIGRTINVQRFLVPNQAVMLRPPLRECGVTDTSVVTSDQMHILAFQEEVEVASSKAKPKTLTLTTTCGKLIKFLSKREKDGDLRKDARLMEFNSVVNRLLSENTEGSCRTLRLRTYAVVCLNEECGLLEWVNNTRCIRHLISDAYGMWPHVSVPAPNIKDILKVWPDVQKSLRFDIASLVAEYQRIISSKSKPCFHRWFVQTFSDPTQWLEARCKFTRSAAVWSVVGHIMGLGDRHTENILLDVTCGECVHVDFDCLFDKGLTLERPEIVPFRLTPNMVDAMGLTGVEGVFRRTMEACLNILRQHKELLLSVLEPFLRDPSVAWKRGGRAQRTGSAILQHAAAVAVAAPDQENEDASETLNIISERLRGIYNVCHPHAENITKTNAARSKPRLVRGIGANKKEELPLSVEGQVHRLIDEAISVENLAQMFIGWMPWV